MTRSPTASSSKAIGQPWWRAAWVFALVPLVLGITSGLACVRAAGDSLGLFFGGVIFAAVLVPPMALAVGGWLGRGLNTLAIVAGIAGVWFFAAVKEQGTTAAQWAGCTFVLAAYAEAAAGFAFALRAVRFGHVAASAVAVVVGLAWMTWPIWLAPQLETPAGPALANWLVPAHPLITINGLLPQMGTWNEQSIAYHLTNLGNDVPYTLQKTPWTAVAVHAGLAAMFVVIAIIAPLRRKPATAVHAANGA